MAKTKKEQLDDTLTAIMQVGQIKACGIVSKEGLLINSRTPLMLMPEFSRRSVQPLWVQPRLRPGRWPLVGLVRYQ